MLHHHKNYNTQDAPQYLFLCPSGVISAAGSEKYQMRSDRPSEAQECTAGSHKQGELNINGKQTLLHPVLKASEISQVTANKRQKCLFSANKFLFEA